MSEHSTEPDKRKRGRESSDKKPRKRPAQIPQSTERTGKLKRSASVPPKPSKQAEESLPSMDAKEYARAKKIQSVQERMARLGWVLQHRICEYLESID